MSFTLSVIRMEVLLVEKNPKSLMMSKTSPARSLHEATQVGLRILAGIIAREAVKDQLSKMQSGNLAPLFVDTTPAQNVEYLEGAAQR